ARSLYRHDPPGLRAPRTEPRSGAPARPPALAAADQTILWRRLDAPGHESARLFSKDSSWHLVGTAVFAHERQPCRLDYVVVCDSGWRTDSGRVTGWVGDATIEVELSADSARRRRPNGVACPTAQPPTHPDPNPTPTTNQPPK